jgi:major membrane immunogen (membrane-anchored lipoprotein)
MMIGKGNMLDAMIIEVADGKILASTQNFTLQKYETEIPQEDGTDKMEMVDELANIQRVSLFSV